jgi:lipoprotein-anchoring transpeptidase ErfK/SrfK
MFKIVSFGLISFLTTILLIETADARQRHAHINHRHHHKVNVKKHHRKPAPPPIVVASVDVSSQTMHVEVNGWTYGNWRVSTARAGYSTPHGSFRVQRLARVYYSKKYDNSPMPYSVFFYGGNAIHGTTHLGALGRPASHGCVRLAPRNAEALFELVEQYGAARTKIVIQD